MKGRGLSKQQYIYIYDYLNIYDNKKKVFFNLYNKYLKKEYIFVYKFIFLK